MAHHKPNALYGTLGIDVGCTESEVKKAYRQLAMRHHPDKVQDIQLKKEAEIRFKEISHAYAILSDPAKRKRYDATGNVDDDMIQNPYSASAFGMGDMANLFNDIFSSFVRNEDANEHIGQPTRAMNLEVPLLLNEIRMGSLKRVELDLIEKCDTCDGHGVKDPKMDIIECVSCGGSGMITHAMTPFLMAQMMCPSCQGKGSTVRAPERICASCNGKRTRSVKRSIDVRVPPGVRNDYIYTLSNHGSYQLDADRRCDVHLRFKHKLPQDYEIDPSTGDVHLKLNIELADVLCGFNSTLNLYGESVEVGRAKYQSPVEEDRIVGMGVPKTLASKTMGDLVIHYNVVYPASDSDDSNRLIKFHSAFKAVFHPQKRQYSESSPNASGKASPAEQSVF